MTETQAYCSAVLITAVKSVVKQHPVYIKNTRILGYLLRKEIFNIFDLNKRLQALFVVDTLRFQRQLDCRCFRLSNGANIFWHGNGLAWQWFGLPFPRNLAIFFNRLVALSMDKLWLTGLILGQVFNSRSGCVCAMKIYNLQIFVIS